MQASLRCHQKYSLSTDIYQHRSQIQIHIDESLPVSIKTKCPAKKIIRIANNILKLNLFECALLCLLIKKTPIETQLQQLQNFNLQTIQVLNQTFDKKVLMFLLLNGYHVKSNFLTSGAQVDIDPMVLEHVPDFRDVYKQWKPEKSVKNISIVEINKFFESWNDKKNSTIVKGKIDYNKIVDKILILSKTYNVGGGDDAGSVRDERSTKNNNNHNKRDQPAKKRKPNEPQQIKIRYCEQKDLQSDNPAQNSPMKNSVSNKIPWFEDNNDLMNMGRSQRTINRSFYNLRSDDVNGNMFQSFRSQDSGMLDSLRNTNNGRFFNLNNSFVNINNHSLNGGGFGMFKSSLESDILQVNEASMKKSKKKGSDPVVKLKPTVSFDELG